MEVFIQILKMIPLCYYKVKQYIHKYTYSQKHCLRLLIDIVYLFAGHCIYYYYFKKKYINLILCLGVNI